VREFAFFKRLFRRIQDIQRSLASDDLQYPQVFLGDRNARAAAKGVTRWDKLEDPMVSLILHGHFVIVVNGVRGGLAGRLEPFEKRI